jgi:uncharacterized protein (DUF1330 family)
MIYITQLIYITAGKEDVFDEFERVAIPLIPKHGGSLMLRVRPVQVVEGEVDVPHEIHLVSFPTEQHFEAFRRDETRKSFLHLKEASVKSSLLVKGHEI